MMCPQPSPRCTGAATSSASKCLRLTNGLRRRCGARSHGLERIVDRNERDDIARRFGVAPEQVERDHLISYLLAFLSANFGERIHFIGGTALARTHLPEGRLSEDIDLIALDDRRAVAADLDAAAEARSGGMADQAAGLRLPRYAQCKAVLRDDTTFISGEGVGLNRIFNRLSRGTTLNSDGDEHDQRRKLVAHRLLPRALRTMSDVVTHQAEQLVAAAVRRQRVDGVTDLATALPLSVVPDLVGWPKDRRQHLLRWGGATFDVLGPLNRYALKSVPASLQMLRFSKDVVRRRSVIHGSMGHDIFAAADAGKLRHSECSALMIDYLAPSLDTTISGIASALAFFAIAPGPVGAAARRAVPAAQCDQRGAAIRVAVAGVQPKGAAAD